MTADVSVDMDLKKLALVVRFETAKYSERYQVSVQSHGFHFLKNVSKVTESVVRLRSYDLLLVY